MRKFVVNVMVVVTVACFAYRSGGQDRQYAPLEVFANGPGRISPLDAGQMLEVWQTYNMVATPDPGAAFYNWEYVDVFIRTTRVTNDSGGIITNVQKTVTSKSQFFLSPELIFTARPVFVAVYNDQLTTTSAYGWRANFGPAREPVEPDVYRTRLRACLPPALYRFHSIMDSWTDVRKMLVVVVPVVAIAFLLYVAMAIQSFLPARPSSLRNACVANLRHIQSVKMEWAKANNRQATDTPGEAELIGTNGYLRLLPMCPSGGIYTFSPVDQNPTCTLSNQGHRLQ